jgi:anti-sigma regulatory factor (Ser/Thr protein kinase)
MPQPNAQKALRMSMISLSDEHVVAALSRLVSDFCLAMVADEDDAWRFQLAAYELAENVVRYSTGPCFRIEVELDESRVLRVRTTNETSPERLREVDRRIHELTETDDPIALYDRIIREAAPRQDGSGLGLARIRAEGELEIEHSIEGCAVTICVQAPVVPREVA